MAKTDCQCGTNIAGYRREIFMHIIIFYSTYYSRHIHASSLDTRIPSLALIRSGPVLTLKQTILSQLL
jgi:hypothetical protein